MLYDLNKDLKQNTDISKQPENATLVKKYSEKLKVMRDFVNQDPIKNGK
jgi:nitrate reductase cytochrome c-type subunit